MLKGAVGRRYARAIFDLAAERGDFDRWLEDLRRIEKVLTEPRVVRVMANPEIAFEAKKEIVDRVLPDIDRLGRNLLYLLIGRRRSDVVTDICTEFEALVNEHRGIVYADVTTAVALNEAEVGLVGDRLSKLTGKQVKLRQTVDPALIGGVIARIGDQLIDGSVRGRLEALRERLIERGV